MAKISPSLPLRLLQGSASLTARSWPLMSRLLPERLEIDDNRSIWVAGTPDYRPNPPLTGRVNADLAIIGGGFTGVSAAYYVGERLPQRKIVLLEAASLANGASGRNGGLALHWVNGVDNDDPEQIRRIFHLTDAGLTAMRTLIQRHQLPVDHRFDGTLTLHTSQERAEAAHAQVERLADLEIPQRFLYRHDLAQEFAAQGVQGATLELGAGQINGAQFVRSLRPVLEERGVAIYEGTPVLRVQPGRRICLTTPRGEVEAGAVVLAANAYIGKLGFFRDAFFPLHASVFASAPLSAPQRAELGWRQYAGFADDRDRISYGSMTGDGRLVFGGGSNRSYTYLFNNRTILRPETAAARRGQTAMTRTLAGYFPAATEIPITHRWSGVLDITLDRQPLWGRIGEYNNIYYALGFCGHGVNLANLAGEFIADLYAGDDSRWRGLPFYQNRYPPIPPEPFRWLGYQFFTRLTGRSPRV